MMTASPGTTTATGDALQALIARSTDLSAHIRREHLRLKLRTALRKEGVDPNAPEHVAISNFHRELVRVTDVLIGKNKGATQTDQRQIFEMYAAVVGASLNAFAAGTSGAGSTLDEMRAVAEHVNAAFKSAASQTLLYAGM